MTDDVKHHEFCKCAHLVLCTNPLPGVEYQLLFRSRFFRDKFYIWLLERDCYLRDVLYAGSSQNIYG